MEKETEIIEEIFRVFKKYNLSFEEAIELLPNLQKVIEHIALKNKF